MPNLLLVIIDHIGPILTVTFFYISVKAKNNNTNTTGKLPIYL